MDFITCRRKEENRSRRRHKRRFSLTEAYRKIRIVDKTNFVKKKCEEFERSVWEGTMKLFKEERDGDVVYNIYLKKVRYKRSSPCVMQQEPEGDNVSYLEWQMQKVKVIKAATVEKLVENLPAAVETLDSSYINVFFSTYTSFANTRQVLDMLLARYLSLTQDETMHSKEERNRVLRSIRSVLMMWLDENLDDFKEPPKYPCLQCLLEFAEEKIADKELAQRVKLKISQFQEEELRKRSKGPHKLYQHDDEVDTVSTENSYADLSRVDNQLLAEQLTIRDAELFRRVNPQHCLGSIWSRRDKNSNRPDVSSVKATINQFNSVCNCVMTTVLADTDMNAVDRAKIICKWIETAKSCREMKNFSSSKAIISGLQAQPVYRLKKSWAAVPKPTMLIFEDLAQIFMDDNNFEVSRDILNKEGTAKFAYIESPRIEKITRKPGSMPHLLTRRISTDKIGLARRDSGRMHGTVPYLGTFLTDLIKIDAAHPDTTADNLVNFEKRRKEFEVIAQIKLLQNSAKNYQFQSDQAFKDWFQDIRIMDYKACCEVSEQIEAPIAVTPTTPPVSDDKATRPKTLRRWISYSPDDFKTGWHGSPSTTPRGHGTRAGSSSSSLSSNSSQESTNSHDSGNSSLHEVHENQIDDNVSHRSEESPETTSKRDVKKANRPKSLTLSKSMSDLTTLVTPNAYTQENRFQFPSPDSSRIIRVSLEDNNICNVYKSILVTDHDHTPGVIRSALDKHNLESEDASEYNLRQIIPQAPELLIPDDANVFYGMNTTVGEARFILKKKDTIEPKLSLTKQRNKVFPTRRSMKREPAEESTYL
ncbi:LOW QUALITY PROTEIN: ral guanine nucleotide dissociation stimulator-like 1 [Amphiura filiformis]|uniref:LOW QUALITY PROTEIN: ral guanine nucleotide dissociation stimulator-like 1 n=1 Tax=Amphiura filiformis TaxID=82378 RepID=UPI003B221245